MPDIILISCPKCNKQMKTRAEVAGKKVRCQGCGEPFTAKTIKARAETKSKPQPAPAKSPAPKVSQEDDANPYAFLADDAIPTPTKEVKPAKPTAPAQQPTDPTEKDPYGLTHLDLSPRCPFCTEILDEDAVLCLNCGYNTQTRTRPAVIKVYHHTSYDYFKWLLPGILSALVIPALLGFDWWFIYGLADSWKETFEDWPETIPQGIKTWEIIFSLFFMYKATRFAVKRLIQNPKPPEIIVAK